LRGGRPREHRDPPGADFLPRRTSAKRYEATASRICSEMSKFAKTSCTSSFDAEEPMVPPRAPSFDTPPPTATAQPRKARLRDNSPLPGDGFEDLFGDVEVREDFLHVVVVL